MGRAGWRCTSTSRTTAGSDRTRVILAGRSVVRVGQAAGTGSGGYVVRCPGSMAGNWCPTPTPTGVVRPGALRAFRSAWATGRTSGVGPVVATTGPALPPSFVGKAEDHGHLRADERRATRLPRRPVLVPSKEPLVPQVRRVDHHSTATTLTPSPKIRLGASRSSRLGTGFNPVRFSCVRGHGVVAGYGSSGPYSFNPVRFSCVRGLCRRPCPQRRHVPGFQSGAVFVCPGTHNPKGAQSWAARKFQSGAVFVCPGTRVRNVGRSELGKHGAPRATS